MKTLLKSVALVAALLIGSISSAHEGHDHPPLAGHLSFKQNTLHIHASFPAAPVVGQESLLVLEAKDAKTHQPTELNDNIEVVLWMPSMGHGSAPTQVERTLDASGNVVPGVFNVRNVYFIMGGEWEVRVTLTDAQGVKETKSFTVILDGGHDHGGHH
jgi:YtkA-like